MNTEEFVSNYILQPSQETQDIGQEQLNDLLKQSYQRNSDQEDRTVQLNEEILADTSHTTAKISKSKITIYQEKKAVAKNIEMPPAEGYLTRNKRTYKQMRKGHYAEQMARQELENNTKILECISRPNFVAKHLKHDDDKKNAYISFESQLDTTTIKIGEAVKEQNYYQIVDQMKKEINAKIPKLQKKLHEQRRYNIYDNNTRTPISEKMEVGETLKLFLKAMTRAMPITGGQATLVDKAELTDQISKPLSQLSEDARKRWSDVKRMPASYHHLPENFQTMNGIAERTLGNQYQLNKDSEVNKQLHMQDEEDPEPVQNMYKSTIDVTTYYKCTDEEMELNPNQRYCTSEETRVAIEDLTPGRENEHIPTLMTSIVHEIAGEYSQKWFEAHNQEKTVEISDSPYQECLYANYVEPDTQNVIDASEKKTNEEDNDQPMQIEEETERHTQTKPNFECAKSRPSNKKVRLRDLNIDENAGKEKLESLLIDIGICKQIQGPGNTEFFNDLAEDQLNIMQYNKEARETAWKDYCTGKFQLYDTCFDDWTTSEKISLQKAKLLYNLNAAAQLSDARLESLVETLRSDNILHDKHCDSFHEIVKKALKQAISENNYTGTASFISAWTWNLVQLTKEHEATLSTEPKDYFRKGKGDKIQKNKNAEQVALAAYASVMITQGKWEIIPKDKHTNNRKAAAVQVHPDRHNHVFIKNFGVCTEEQRLGTRLGDQKKKLQGSQSQASKHYGQDARVICASNIINKVFNNSHEVGDMLNIIIPTTHHAFQPAAVPKEMADAGHYNICSSDIDNAWQGVEIPEEFRTYFSLCIDGTIIYPRFMPHGFKAATKMFRVLTAWLERAALKVFHDAIHSEGLNQSIKKNGERRSFEQKFIQEKILDLTKPSTGHNDKDFQDMIQARITAKMDLTKEESLKKAEHVVTQLLDKIGTTMNAIPTTDLRAIQMLTHIFTYVDDCLVSSIREDVGWCLQMVYTSVAALSGVYLNPKKICLRPKQNLGLVFAIKVVYEHDTPDEDNMTPALLSHTERRVRLQPQFRQKAFGYVKQLEKARTNEALNHYCYKTLDCISYITTVTRSPNAVKCSKIAQYTIKGLMQTLGGNTYQAKRLCLNMLLNGDRNPLLYDGITRLGIEGITTPKQARLALQSKSLQAVTVREKGNISIPKETVRRCEQQLKELFDAVEEPIIRPNRMPIQELRILVDAARYTTSTSNSMRKVQGICLMALESQESNLLNLQREDLLRKKGKDPLDKSLRLKRRADASHWALHEAASHVVHAVTSGPSEYIQFMLMLSDTDLPGKPEEVTDIDEYMSRVREWEAGVSQQTAEMLGACLAIILPNTQLDLVIYSDNKAVVEEINRSNHSQSTPIGLLMHLCIEGRNIAGSNIRSQWIRGDTNIADYLTRMAKLINPSYLEQIYRNLQIIYKKPFGYYQGDLERFQQTLVSHRKAEARKIKDDEAQLTTKTKDPFHIETTWQGKQDAIGKITEQALFKWTGKGSIEIIDLRLRLELQCTLVSHASFTILRPDLIKNLQKSTVDEYRSQDQYQAKLEEMNGEGKGIDQALKTMHIFISSYIANQKGHQELVNYQAIVEQIRKKILDRSIQQMAAVDQILKTQAPLDQKLTLIEQEKVTLMNRIAHGQRNGISEFTNSYERHSPEIVDDKKALKKKNQEALDVTRECIIHAVISGSNTIKNSRVASFHFMRSLQPAVVISLFDEARNIIQQLYVHNQIPWLNNIGVNTRLHALEAYPKVGPFVDTYNLASLGWQSKILTQLSEMIQGVQTVKDLPPEEQESQVHLLTCLAQALLTMYGNQRCYNIDFTKPEISENISIDFKVPEVLYEMSYKTITTSTFINKVNQEMKVMFGIQIYKRYLNEKYMNEIVEDIEKFQSRYRQATQGIKPQRLNLAQAFFVIKPEVTQWDQKRWASLGTVLETTVAQFYARFIFSRALQASSRHDQLKRVIEYTTKDIMPQPLEAIASFMAKDELLTLRNKAFEKVDWNQLKDQVQEPDDKDRCTQLATKIANNDIFSQSCKASQQQQLKAIAMNNPHLQIGQDLMANMESQCYVRRHHNRQQLQDSHGSISNDYTQKVSNAPSIVELVNLQRNYNSQRIVQHHRQPPITQEEQLQIPNQIQEPTNQQQ